jgi:hypothetical protein
VRLLDRDIVDGHHGLAAAPMDDAPAAARKISLRLLIR